MGRKAKVALFSACAAGEQKEAAARKGISGQDGVVVHKCCVVKGLFSLYSYQSLGDYSYQSL